MEANTLVKTYIGTETSAIVAFERDSRILKLKGYYPISQSYQQGQWGVGAFIFAVVLCLILVGFIALIYMMIVKPDGTLTVSYKAINKTELNEFISLYVENETVCKKERELKKIFEKVSNNNLNITNEDIARAISTIDLLIKNESTKSQKTIEINTLAPSGDDLANRIRKLKLLLEEGLIDQNEFNNKKKEILDSL